MKKEIISIVGSSSWWKNIKFRKEATLKLKNLRKEWRYIRKEIVKTSNDSIDTKIYKKYYFKND